MLNLRAWARIRLPLLCNVGRGNNRSRTNSRLVSSLTLRTKKSPRRGGVAILECDCRGQILPGYRFAHRPECDGPQAAGLVQPSARANLCSNSSSQDAHPPLDWLCSPRPSSSAKPAINPGRPSSSATAELRPSPSLRPGQTRTESIGRATRPDEISSIFLECGQGRRLAHFWSAIGLSSIAVKRAIFFRASHLMVARGTGSPQWPVRCTQ